MFTTPHTLLVGTIDNLWNVFSIVLPVVDFILFLGVLFLPAVVVFLVCFITNYRNLYYYLFMGVFQVLWLASSLNFMWGYLLG